MWRQMTIAKRQTITLATMPASSARQIASKSVLVADEVEHQHEHEDDQRAAGAGAADAGLGARMRGDRDDQSGLLAGFSRLVLRPCPSSCHQPSRARSALTSRSRM